MLQGLHYVVYIKVLKDHFPYKNDVDHINITTLLSMFCILKYIERTAGLYLTANSGTSGVSDAVTIAIRYISTGLPNVLNGGLR